MSTKVPWWNIEVGAPEIESVARAIERRQISQGTLTAQFEERLARLLGAEHVVCTTSGTSALLLSFLAIGLGPGDEIIAPNRTFIATVHAAMLLGARVKLVDVHPESALMDERALEPLLGARTKAIVPVHLNGRAVRMDAVTRIAERHGLDVVEDACQAFLSRAEGGGFLGTLSRFGCFSLGMAKVLTTGQGGFVACRSASDAALLRRLKNQGVNDVTTEKGYEILAGNFKYTDIQAAIGLAQLERLPARRERQISIYRRYEEGLRGVGFLRIVPVAVDRGAVPLRAECLCTERERFIEAMKEREIAVLSQVPNLQFSPHLGVSGEFPGSQVHHDHLVILPCGPDQPLESVDATLAAIRDLDGVFRPW